MRKVTYSEILKIQRDQLNQKEEELRYIAANVESLIDSLNRKVILHNTEINFDKDPLGQVFRGSDLNFSVDSLVRMGLHPEGKNQVG
jgi:hypothetical protein